MTLAVAIKPLACHRELMPLVAEWFRSEWPDWYGPAGPGNAVEDVAAFAASGTDLPLAMLIFEGDTAVGAGALKTHSIPSHAHLGPWAAAGYVVPACRGRGLGALLLEGLVVKAHALGFQRLYCGTSTAQSLLARAGWTPFEVTVHAGQPLTVFQSAA